MAQHDYDVANADGATVRADLNSLFEAIATQNSGATAPGTTFAFMYWFDTANSLLKQRNSANNAWVTVASLSGTTWTPYYQGAALGSASTRTAGTAAGNVPVLDGSARMPAVDGSQLTNLTVSGWQFVEKVTASGGASIVLGEGNLVADYDYMICARNVKNSGDQTPGQLVLQYGTGGTPTYQTSGYVHQSDYAISTTTGASSGLSTSGIPISSMSNLGGASAGETWDAEIVVSLPAANAIHRAKIEQWGSSETGAAGKSDTRGWRTTAEVVTGLRIIGSGITFDSGDFYLLRRKMAA